MPWRCSRVASSRAAAWVDSGVSAGSTAYTRSSMCCASAPGYSPAIVATTWRGRSVVSSAHSTTAPCERSQPSRPARRTISTGSMSGRERSSSRNEPRRFCSTSSRASSTATSVRQATAARCRNSSPSSSGSPSSSTRPIVSSPEAIGTSPPMPGGTEAGRPRARSPT